RHRQRHGRRNGLSVPLGAARGSPTPLGESRSLGRTAARVDNRPMRRAILLGCAGLLLLGGSTASALKMPSAPRCPVFPKSNPWNQRVDSLPVAASSDEIVRSIGANGSVH